jgi:hypothetical protein
LSALSSQLRFDEETETLAAMRSIYQELGRDESSFASKRSGDEYRATIGQRR